MFLGGRYSAIYIYIFLLNNAIPILCKLGYRKTRQKSSSVPSAKCLRDWARTRWHCLWLQSKWMVWLSYFWTMVFQNFLTKCHYFKWTSWFNWQQLRFALFKSSHWCLFSERCNVYNACSKFNALSTTRRQWSYLSRKNSLEKTF